MNLGDLDFDREIAKCQRIQRWVSMMVVERNFSQISRLIDLLRVEGIVRNGTYGPDRPPHIGSSICLGSIES